MSTGSEGLSPAETPPPPEDGWWESLFAREEAHPRIAETASRGGDGGSPADWEWARQLYERDEPVELPVVDSNRGGLLVQAGGLRGFVPVSHVLELCREARSGATPDLRRFIGRRLKLRVIEFDPTRGRLVFSERAALAEPGRRHELLRCLEPGEKVSGTISNLTPFGAFVDLGGIEGLIHVSEISWGRVRHPADVLRMGEPVEAVVISTDPDLGRIALSLKALKPDPWIDLAGRLSVGDVVRGRTTSIVKFGAFVEIEDGVEGLVHASELGSDGPCEPGEVLREGDALVLRVIRFEPDHRRLGLSLREVGPASGPRRSAPGHGDPA